MKNLKLHFRQKICIGVVTDDEEFEIDNFYYSINDEDNEIENFNLPNETILDFEIGNFFNSNQLENELWDKTVSYLFFMGYEPQNRSVNTFSRVKIGKDPTLKLLKSVHDTETINGYNNWPMYNNYNTKINTYVKGKIGPVVKRKNSFKNDIKSNEVHDNTNNN